MRVLIDTTFAARGPSGTGVYVRRLIEALGALGIDVVEAANERRGAPGGGGLPSARNFATDRWWTAVELPRRAREANADVVHHPLPAFSRAVSAAQAVTVHDLAFERLPGHFDPRFRRYAQRAHRAAARRADVVIAVSHATAADVRSHWDVAPERIVVAPHGPGQELAGPAGGRASPAHFLYVGDDEPRKNLGLLLAAYGLYRESAGSNGTLPLVLAGSANAEQPGVQAVQRPDADQLAALYAGAAALVHPALHEGFGLTPLEAMSAGTPVLAARNPGVIEVCEDAALYVDPGDAPALAAELARLAADEALRGDLSARGLRRAAEFTWARSARAHIDAYTLAVGNKAMGNHG